MANKIVLLVSVSLGIILVSLIHWLRSGGNQGNVRRIGINPGFMNLHLLTAKKEFRARGHRLIATAYHEVQLSPFFNEVI